MPKYRYRQSDIYLPGTDIPVNRLGITDAEALREIEWELLEQAYVRFIEALTLTPFRGQGLSSSRGDALLTSA